MSVQLWAPYAAAAEPVEKFTIAVGNGKTSEALDYMDPELKQLGGMKLVASLNEFGARAMTRGGVKSAKVLETKIDGDHAVLKVEEVFRDGKPETIETKARKVDGKWYVTA